MVTASAFLEHGLERLDAAAASRLLCAFDFDGTLAPIVTQPEQARTPLPVLQRLCALRRVAPVAVITGRAAADAAQRLGFAPDFLIGNHGQEGLPGGERQAGLHRAQCAAWRTALQATLPEGCREAGVWIEDKTQSLSLHYRLARDQHAAEQQLRALVARLAPAPRVVGGKCVLNLVPADAPHKGTALLQLMQACGAEQALYVGDDVTDEDVFRLEQPELLAVRIGRDPSSAARFYLNHRLDLITLLDRLLLARRRCGAGNWITGTQERI